MRSRRWAAVCVRARTRTSRSCSGIPTGQASWQEPQSEDRNGSSLDRSPSIPSSSGVSTEPIGPE